MINQPSQLRSAVIPAGVFLVLLFTIIGFGIADLVQHVGHQKSEMLHAGGSAVSEASARVTAEDRRRLEQIRHGESLYLTCAACHGEHGEGNKTLHAPALNVQEDWYIETQLNNFRNGIRGTDPNDVAGLQMRPAAQALRNSQAVSDVAVYITSLKTEDVYQPQTTSGGDTEKGRRYYGACVACHGDRGQGNKALHAPRLAGQHDWYLVMQLKNFKSGIRGADPRDTLGAVMRPMLMTLPNDQAIIDVASYIATFPVDSGQPLGTTTGANSSVPEEPDAKAGRELFVTNCAACHQTDGAGQAGLAPSIRNRDFLAIADDDFIRKTVLLGRPGTAMIARPDLSPRDLDHIIAFLRALPVENPVSIIVDPDKTISGDAVAGSTMFGTFCASCHGPAGEGYSAGGSGPGIGLPGFLNLVCDDYVFQTVKHGRLGTPMKSFIGPGAIADLTESDVADIISHLRTLQHKVPPEVAADITLRQSEKGNPATGRVIFAANCAACHQDDGEGKVGLAPSLRNRDFLAVASDDFIRTTIRQGRMGTAMVQRPDLSDTDIDHIIAFLRSGNVDNSAGVKIDPASRYTTGDAGLGRATFDIFCASCHGPNGEGYSAGGSGPGIGLDGFLDVASDDFILETIRHGRTGTPMRSFIGAQGIASLQESDIHDVIAFLRSL